MAAAGSATIGLSVAAYVVTSQVLQQQVDDSLRTGPASMSFAGPDTTPDPDAGPGRWTCAR